MCLITKKIEILIADKDILVEKLIGKDMKSSVFGYDYSKHDPSLLSTPKGTTLEDGVVRLEGGYYSWPIGKGTYTAIFKIPKGSIYVKSDIDDQIVSEMIEFVEFKEIKS